MTTRAPLTPAERAVYHLLIDHLAEHTFQPSVREIGRQLRIPSTKTVTDLLASLEAKGYVRRGGGRSRGVVLLGFAGGAGTVPVPVMRLEAEGGLILSHHLTIDRTLAPTETTYLLAYSGPSIVSHAIQDGDLLRIDPSCRASDEALLLVRLAGRIAVRPLQDRGTTLRLGGGAEGSAQSLDHPDDAVLGVVTGVIRTAESPPR